MKKKMYFLKAIPVAVISGALLTAALNSSADVKDGGLYAGAYYGGFKSRGGEFEDENDYFEGVIGVKVNGFFALEGSYTDFGNYGGDVASADVNGYGIAAIGSLPVSDTTALYAKAGKFYSTVELDVLGFEDDFDDDQIFYGVGVDFAVFDPVIVSIEYDRYKVDIDNNIPVDIDDSDTDIDTIKVGAKFVF